ncbi:hypothetical protein [Natrinema sp. 74]|uniref:hypothetical protein n=1 Tax=Natrinema sp. 74 TaxID=3384159 RepID=UPI0038D39436
MSKRALLLAVVLASGLIAAAVPGAVAQHSSVTVSQSQVDVGTSTETNTMTIENTGNETATFDVTVDDSPSGVTVDPDQDTVTLDAGQQTNVTLTIDAADDAGGGEVVVSAGDSSASFDVTRPAIAGFENEPLDIGDVLVGESASGAVSIEELTGEGTLTNVDATVVSTDPDADLGVGANSTSMYWNVYVDSDVEQHETLSWKVELVPNGNTDAARTVEVKSRVIYPADFGTISLEDEMTFDEPRNSTSTITKTVDLEVENAGDLPLELDEVTAYSSNTGINVEVADRPQTIDGGRQVPETIELAVTADTGLEEGTYTISGTVSSTNVSASDTRYRGNVTIKHGTRLDVPSRIDIGDVPIGEPKRRSTTIGEALGYNDVANLEITHKSGPERWMTIEKAPSELAAGGSQAVVFRTAFDTDADLGTSYEWTYTVDGDGVKKETITVVASPVPLDLDPIRRDIAAYDGSVAERTVSMIETMDQRMRAGTVSNKDVTTVLSYGSAVSLYLESMTAARDHQSAGEYEAAQTEIVQAAAAYNTMTLYGDELESEAFRDDSSAVETTARNNLDTVINDQQTYYEDRLETGNVSLVEEATIKRQLARIVSLQGDAERAAELEASADSAFERYTEAVSDGEQARQRAAKLWTTMKSEQFVTVAGQPLLLNPAEYDAYTDRVDAMNAAYENATATFESAGETGRADAVATQHRERMNKLRVTRLSLFGSIAVYALLVAGIVFRTARGMYWYLRDARESVSGDFLV